MPFDLRDDRDRGVILVRWRGRFSADEAHAFSRRLPELPGFVAGNPSFHDMRAADADIPASEIRRVAYSRQTEPPRAVQRRIAILVADDLAYGMFRMLAALREDENVTVDVFREIAEAVRWLGLAVEGDPFAGW
jgi:hypothetical protein